MRMNLGHFLSLCLLVFSSLGYSQYNFVSNGSFEDKTGCPNSLGDIEKSLWRLPINHIGSSDYFHGCSGVAVCDVPGNYFGSANAADGIAYAGIYVSTNPSNYREYIMDTLKQGLVSGRPYVVSFEYRLATNCTRAAWDLGFWLTSNHPTQTTSPYNGSITSNPTSRNDSLNYLDNDSYWETYIDTIIAGGGEHYITIGAFEPTTTWISNGNIGGTVLAAYYYIDDVKIHEYPGVYGDSIICADSVAQIHSAFLESVYWVDSANASTIISYNDTIWVSPTTNTTYWCIGSTSDDTFSFEVQVVSPPQNFLIDDTTICANEVLEVSVAYPIYSKFWSDSSTGDTLIADSGEYWLELTAGSCKTSDTFNLYNFTEPQFDLISDTSICDYDTLELSTGLSGFGHLWSTGDTTNTILIVDSGLTTVEVSDLNCTYHDSTYVIFFNHVDVDIGSDEVICFLTDTTITASYQNATTWNWSTGQTGSQIVVTSSGTYEITVASDNCEAVDSVDILFHDQPVFELGKDTSICWYDSLVLQPNLASGTYQFEWSDGSTQESISLTDTLQGIYWLKVSDSLCSAWDTIRVDRRVQFNIDLDGAVKACVGDSVLLSVNSSDTLSYLWSQGSDSSSISVSQAGMYYVSATDNICTEVDSSEFVEVEFPEVSIGSDTVLCNSDDFSIEVSVDILDCTYEWYDGQNTKQIDLSATDVGSIWVAVTNEICTSYDTINVERSTPPEIVVPEDVLICSDDPTIIEIQGDQNWQYTWSNGLSGSVVSVSQSGSYAVSVSDENCTTIDSVRVDLYPIPDIEILGSDYICLGEELTLAAAGTGFENVRWNNGWTDSTMNVIEPGIYSVEAQYACGTIQDTLEVKDCECFVWLPSAFVPRSSINAFFGAKVDCDIYEFDFRIFDRWGNELFQTNDPSEWWDGTYNGEIVQLGVYSWQMIFEADFGGRSLVEYKSGAVTVLR